jgi:hypothetical protein
MRVNRKFLYFGIFLVAIGGVIVTADLAAADAAALRDALSLWPLAIVAIGLGIAARRTSLSLPAGLLAAAVPGLVLGGGFALAPRMVADCGVSGPPQSVAIEEGTFDGPAQVLVSTGCGSLTVDIAPGNAWRFERGDDRGKAPSITTSGNTLSIDAVGERWWQRFDDHRDSWHVTLPTSPIEDLSVVVNTGEGHLSLSGARIERLDLTTNAGLAVVDLSDADVGSLVSIVNAGALTYQLADADLTASFELNAGALEVCAPDRLGLRVRQDGDLSGISIHGQQQTANVWQSPNYLSATHKADLQVSANLGSVEINPIGGCK